MAGSIKGIIVEIGGDTSGLQKALSKVNSATSSLSKELKGINSLLKLDPKNTELLSQKQTVLKENIKLTIEQINNLKEAQRRYIESGGDLNTAEYRKLQREIINTQNKLSDLKNESSNWTKAGDQLIKWGENLDKISSKLDNLGNKLTTRLTVPIVGTFATATKEAIEFESAFTGVTKTVDGTEEQLENLKQGIKDLAKEIPSSTTEIAAVAEAAGQLGIQTDNILSFSKAMIDLGNSTNLTSEEAASQLAKFANIMQMSQTDFDKLGSAIVDLGNNFATTEADIVNMAMRLAGAGKQVGLSEGEVLGLSTALSSVGIEAEMGGSAISKAMVKMQNAVELGGGKLNTVLGKTGKSLRDLELLSANNSKDFKELCDSIGMTSTEVKQLITAGTNLEDFAKVSGMTSEQFKKAWQEDAVGALTTFIKGLGDAESKGESAITMLSEMGLTEVRLRDSLLRAANAGDLLNTAVETGTKAFEDNVALTKEANKRYATMESKLKITKNKIKDVAVSLGDKLLPSINKILEKADKWIKKLDNLSDSQKDNIVKIGLMVAAAGPLLKIGSSAISIVENVSKGIGTFSKAISLAHNGIGTATGSAATLAKVLQGLTSSTGLLGITTGITASAIVYFATKETEAEKKHREFAEKMKDSKVTLEEYNKSIDDVTNANLNQINSCSKLKDELKTLVDENGKVKEGYKRRADFILQELNDALGTEYKLNGDIIQNYKDLQNEIDKTIEKKKAEIILNADEEKYKNAIQNQEEAVKKLKEAHDNLGMSIDEAKKKRQELIDEYYKYTDGNGGTYKESKELKELNNLISAYEDAEWIVKDYTDKINTYTSNYEKFVEEKYSEIGNIITSSTEDWSKKSLKEIIKNIKEQSDNLETYKSIYKETGNDISKQLIQKSQENLNILAKELNERTSTVNKLSREEILAWKIMANKSYEAYSYEISQMAPEMQKKIQDVTKVIAGGTPQMQEKAEELGRKTVEEFDKSAEAKEKALNTIKGYLSGLNDEEKRELLRRAGVENLDIVLKELDKGNLSEENGKNILEGLWKGLKNNTLQGKIIGAASGLAQAVNKAFTGKNGWDEHSPSKKMTQFAEYYIQPISDIMKKKQNNIVSIARNLANSINSAFDNQIKTSQIQDISKLQGSLNNQIIDSTKTIFTTPQITINVQKLGEAELQQCFNYVNRKFGSQY